MTFKEILDTCDQLNLDKYDINIANEVEFFFIDEGGRYREDFERLCSMASEAYLKVDCYISLSAVVESLHRLVVRENRNIDDITRRDIIGNIQNY